MCTLLLNSPAGHASRAFVAQKTEIPHQASNRRQHQKNSEHFAHYLLTILTRREREAPILESSHLSPMKLQ